MAITTKPLYDKDKLLIDIKRKLREGNTQYSITEWVKNNYTISNQALVFAINEAKELIARELDFNYRDVMIKHAARYEEIWKKNFQNPHSHVLENKKEEEEEENEEESIRKTLFKVRNHFITAAEALRSKERMLGIVHNRMDIDLKNEFTEQEKKNKPKIIEFSEFNLSNLNIQEKKELLFLLKKAKGEEQIDTETKITTTISISNQNKEEKDKQKYESNVISKFDIEDIEHEEIKEVLPKPILINKINENLIKQESKRIDDEIKVTKELQKKKDFEDAKKRIIQKYKK